MCGFQGVDVPAMPTEKYPGVLVFFLVSSLSPSQLWTLKTTDALESKREG